MESIGLDIGSDIVKVASISQSKGDLTLNRIGFKSIPERNSPSSIKATIDELFKEAHIARKNVRISVSGPAVITRFIEMPAMKPEEMKSAVVFEAEKCIPYQVNDVYLDHYELGADDKQARTSVMIAAVKRETVNKLLEMLEGLDLDISGISIDSVAALNTFLQNYQELVRGKVVALINIGATKSNLNIICYGQTIFMRDMRVGSYDIINTLKKHTQIEITESRNITAAVEKLEESLGAEEVFQLLKKSMGHFFDETRLSLGFCENQFGVTIEELFVCGGVTLSEAFCTCLGKSVGFEMSKLDPFKSLKFDRSVDADFADKWRLIFPVSTGLAIEGLV